MEFVGIFDPAIADVRAVVHVGDHDVFDARIGLGFGSLAECVVEDDDVCPFRVAFPILGFEDEAGGDVALFFGFDVVANVVALLENLPGDITDKTGERDEEKFAFVLLD